MAKVLAILFSGRKRGYTATLLKEAVRGVKTVKGVKAELIHNFDYEYKPCVSCFSCIRNPEHFCVLDDDFGKKGEGRLIKKLLNVNGLILGDPVHFWGESAGSHLFMERCYPFVWNDALNGIPFASISCASNQGMQMIANRNLCKFAFCLRMRYIGGLPVHTSYYQKALEDARSLGKRLGEAALEDELNGRRKMTDEERWLYYTDKPWNALDLYLENLTWGTFTLEGSLIEYGLKNKTFKKEESIRLLKKAKEQLIQAINAYRSKDHVKAQRYIIASSAYWTHATWKEFLEREVVKTPPPEVYRPIPET